MTVDKVKIYKALALLNSFRDNLPKGNIEMNHVEDYHLLLGSLQEQVGETLDEFRIPKSAFKQREIPQSFSMDAYGNTYGDPYRYEPYCDGHVFKRQLDALAWFIDARLADFSK
jgi:hypothetical protein